MRISVIEGGLAAFALCAVSAFASEIKIPKNGAEDTQGIMAKSYWEQWNGDLNSDIDRDIEANRKADATLYVGKIAAGTKVKVAQISHEFYFGAHIFNFDQLGDKTLNAKYKSLFGTLFNSATVAFYWASSKSRTAACAQRANTGTLRISGQTPKIPRRKSTGGARRPTPS